MKQEAFFHDAKWVGAPARTTDSFAVLRGHFQAEKVIRATLHVLGLGFFRCYVNGQCINPDTFLPLSSDYEAGCDPRDEQLSGHRIYVPAFDITPYLQPGGNVIALHFGGGWYTHRDRPFGLPKAIYCLTLEMPDGVRRVGSGPQCRIGPGFVDDYDFVRREQHNFAAVPPAFDADFDDSAWPNAVPTEPLVTDYCTTDCPADTLVETRPVSAVGQSEAGTVYDCGQNTTGYPVLEVGCAAGERVTVRFSEELLPDGSLDPTHAHGQTYTFISDGRRHTVQPEFTWFGFRYFAVEGAARPVCVKVIRADIPLTADFDCDNETLNWIFRTFAHTMRCNMHTGIPSDCPHLERRGYTGDGQLTCDAALSIFDARAFYEKWLQDIADCQDVRSGHVQYTAPYLRSGGGPGGWGCAIVEVPYQLYRHYGDTAVLARYYDNMRRYIDYLEAHTKFGLVTSDKTGEWCLGDWCGPIVLYPDLDFSAHNQQMLIPAAMVNTYFMVKSLQRMCEIARVIGREDDVPAYEEKIRARKAAIEAAYFNAFDDNFIMNAQGANTYAVDLGLGTAQTYANIVRYYCKLGFYDTGIFATDLLTRLLFEHGDGELAAALMTGDGPQGFAHWRKQGATTFHEYWDSSRSRSHNHPMFGAVVASIFTHLLGIGQQENTAGYSALCIEPKAVSCFGRMSGSMMTPAGRVAVRYTRDGERTDFVITIPQGTRAVFRFAGSEVGLAEGENVLSFPA